MRSLRFWTSAPTKPEDHLLVANISGAGDKDIFTVADHLRGMAPTPAINPRQSRRRAAKAELINETMPNREELTPLIHTA